MDYFKFKQFKIKQEHSAMRVGTDGVLIGAWAEITGDEQHILDVGCGTGLIALMLAQRTESAHIDAVEIEPLAADEAKFNVSISPWQDRVSIYCTSIQEYARKNEIKYDLIISNPPYFIDSSKCDDNSRTLARHASLLPYSELAHSVKSLMKEDGRFIAIFPYEEAKVFTRFAEQNKLFCNKKLNIFPIKGRSIKRIAAEFSFHNTPIIEEDLIISNEQTGDYTSEYRNLTAEFYLKF